MEWVEDGPYLEGRQSSIRIGGLKQCNSICVISSRAILIWIILGAITFFILPRQIEYAFETWCKYDQYYLPLDTVGSQIFMGGVWFLTKVFFKVYSPLAIGLF